MTTSGELLTYAQAAQRLNLGVLDVRSASGGDLSVHPGDDLGQDTLSPYDFTRQVGE